LVLRDGENLMRHPSGSNRLYEFDGNRVLAICVNPCLCIPDPWAAIPAFEAVL